MNTPEVSPKSSFVAVLAAAVIGLVLGGAAIYLLKGGMPFDEPKSSYVVRFSEVQLTTGPQDRDKFVAALGDAKVTFRLDMSITDANGCSPVGNYNVPGAPSNNCTQPNMGQQVTQRVGFNNLANLKEALRYVQ